MAAKSVQVFTVVVVDMNESHAGGPWRVWEEREE